MENKEGGFIGEGGEEGFLVELRRKIGNWRKIGGDETGIGQGLNGE